MQIQTAQTLTRIVDLSGVAGPGVSGRVALILFQNHSNHPLDHHPFGPSSPNDSIRDWRNKFSFGRGPDPKPKSYFSLQNFCQENTDKYYIMESKENGYIFCAVRKKMGLKMCAHLLIY